MAFRPVTHYLAAVLVVLVLSWCGTVHAAATDSQKATTLSFLQGFASQFPGQLSSWTGTDYCSWSGVSCDGDDFVTLSLSGRGLSGYLPSPSNDELIVEIDISNNNGITGNFPSDWAGLKALRVLNMASTGLYGNIPDAWNGMISLQKITITGTAACRSLPEWSNMPALTTVDFSNNNMGGSLQSSWSSITSLTSLSLSGNGFCGCEPDSWKNVAVLHNAVSSMSVANSNCGSKNQCSGTSFDCSVSHKGNSGMGLVSTMVAVASIVCALASVLAL